MTNQTRRSCRPTTPRRPWWATPTTLAVLMVYAAPASARNSPPPAQPSEQTDRIEEARKVLPRVSGEEHPVSPTRPRTTHPVTPGLTAGENWTDDAAQPPATLPEGSYLIERTGRVIAGPNKRWIFVPSADQRTPGEGPLLLLPCAALERLEMTIEGAPGTDRPGAGATSRETQIRVSGEVFVYRDRGHLLVSSFLPGPEDSPVPAPADTPPGQSEPEPSGDAEPPPSPPASVMDDPDVRALLDELRAESPAITSPQSQAPAPGGFGSDADAQPAAITPDGTPVVRRRGRLVRVHDGAWAFVFDNDEPDSLASRSLTVLPCLLLERMERHAFIQGDAHEMLLSGRVYIYQGRPHLLPTMMVRVRANGISPAQ